MKSILLYIALFLLLTSCVTKIESIKDNPKDYLDQVVTVSGDVTKRVKIPFTNFSFIELKDSSDNILVFTLSNYSKGSNITLKTEVVAFDSESSEKSTKEVISHIENFLIDNNLFSKKDVKKQAKNIGNFICKSLNVLEATYFLIEVKK